MAARLKTEADQNMVVNDGDRRSDPPHFPLSGVSPREIVKIQDTFGCGRKRYELASLGLTPGAEVKVCCNLGGPMVIEVRGSRLSLGRGMASKIMVKRMGRVEECACSAEPVCPREIRD